MLAGRAFRNIVRSPHYSDDIAFQMDTIGVGSLLIVVIVGFFSGAVMALQMYLALATYGQVGKTGQLVSITLVRELGPVLTAVMVAGRNASGIASGLGSMKVTEQIDAMRALGTDPLQKLVTPRLIATALMLPLLVVIGDFVGIFGGLSKKWAKAREVLLFAWWRKGMAVFVVQVVFDVIADQEGSDLPELDAGFGTIPGIGPQQAWCCRC